MFNLSLNRVHDTVRVSEGGETLILRVDDDAMRMVAAITSAKKRLDSIQEDSCDADKLDAAKTFARAIFGEKNADALSEFYRNDPACIIAICARYFSMQLAKKITKAQKRGDRPWWAFWRRAA